MKLVYLGSDVAMPVFNALLKSNHEIVGVVCQPDKPNGRNNKIEMSALKRKALENNITVYQFEKISRDGVEKLADLKPDFLISAAYGQILSQKVIDIPKFKTLNVHPSILPKYRGATPVVSSLIAGDKETGVCIMEMQREVDSGDVYKLQTTKINKEETAGELTERLFNIGGKLLVETIDEIVNRTDNKTPQDNSKATFCYKISKEDSKINFNENCTLIKNKVRAYNPSQVAYFYYKNEQIKVFSCKIASKNSKLYKNICQFVKKDSFRCGEIVFAKSKPFGLVIKTKTGFFMPLEIQSASSKKMDIKSYLNGKSFEVGYII